MFCKTVRCHEFFFFPSFRNEFNPPQSILETQKSTFFTIHTLYFDRFLYYTFYKNKLNNETFKTITMQSSNQPNLSENQNTRSNKGGRRRRRPRNRKHKTISAENKQGHTVDKESSLNLTDLSR